jgi:hypothetical protein
MYCKLEFPQTSQPDSHDKKAQVITVTHNQKKAGLKMWKDLLIQTKDYRPFQHRSEEENLKEVKILRTAMSDFRNLRLFGIDTLRDMHPAFAGLQAKYNIPQEFCAPEELFREEQLDYNVLYYKRCCSVYYFYNMLSIDNPCYVERKVRKDGHANGRPFCNVSLAVQEGQYQSIRPEPPAAQAFSKGQAFRLTQSDLKYNPDIVHTSKSSNPAYNPFIHASVQPKRREIVNVKSTNPSDLNRDQMDTAEKTERQRNAPRRNAPIPEEEDSSNTDGETSWLYEDRNKKFRS